MDVCRNTESNNGFVTSRSAAGVALPDELQLISD
jgi:hypothetical protein